MGGSKNMDKLISAEKLYNKVAELEELARDRVLDTPTTSPAHPRYVAQLNERTALKHMIMDEPAAFDKEKVIEELKEEGCIIDDEAGNRVVEIIKKGGV